MIREHLLKEIEKKRAELLQMTSHITIELSQELDHLLIQYQKQRLRAVAGDE
ncbi:aspartyl-phosphate phosphatase Spo0E family protein [Bacillus subtilis]